MDWIFIIRRRLVSHQAIVIGGATLYQPQAPFLFDIYICHLRWLMWMNTARVLSAEAINVIYYFSISVAALREHTMPSCSDLSQQHASGKLLHASIHCDYCCDRYHTIIIKCKLQSTSFIFRNANRISLALKRFVWINSELIITISLFWRLIAAIARECAIKRPAHNFDDFEWSCGSPKILPIDSFGNSLWFLFTRNRLHAGELVLPPFLFVLRFYFK